MIVQLFFFQYNNHEIRSGKHIGVCISVANNRLFVGSIPKSKTKEQIVEEFSKVTGKSIPVFCRGGKMPNIISDELSSPSFGLWLNDDESKRRPLSICPYFQAFYFFSELVMLRTEIFVIRLDVWFQVLPRECV